MKIIYKLWNFAVISVCCALWLLTGVAVLIPTITGSVAALMELFIIKENG